MGVNIHQLCEPAVAVVVTVTVTVNQLLDVDAMKHDFDVCFLSELYAACFILGSQHQ